MSSSTPIKTGSYYNIVGLCKLCGGNTIYDADRDAPRIVCIHCGRHEYIHTPIKPIPKYLKGHQPPGAPKKRRSLKYD